MEALLYEKLEDHQVRCALCCHRCVIAEGQRGICHVRENRSGVLYTLVYGRLVARHIDPIEKKPLFHFLPGSSSYSIATVGCNFRCRFCQNADIAQLPTDHGGAIIGDSVKPSQVVTAAEKAGCRSIAFTYTEPTIFFEYALETARLAHSRGLRNVFVTNGYMTAEALDMIAPFLDAANVDLKAFSPDYYRNICGAKLEHVRETLRKMKSIGVFVEVTTLVVPGLNDAPEELHALASFLASDLGPDTPWHISRFHPTYRLTDRSHTPLQTLRAAREIGLAAGLKYVYTGNVPGDTGENTFCPACNAMLIERRGFQVSNLNVRDGRCLQCDAVIQGVWK
ncbi:MAG: AmmeMemoRadiSam system radical SAM enzyme [Desulfobacterales bacterium]|jgi:pyruvate formate lyase activating enzyme|nr:AmmeMemoRadiSam system radical SAM enzyme [Desulfobacterales bacterium]